ncbi:hypothetical protein [Thermococcus sibiricus]|uniref:Uncharacterized protein n=1 Tax=Thermococcus sibiricus (strain DSM 12597 / MM 739) TaxID=604354 RepID=C6A0D4_THESM|nr:hypothetical protein [Thermococcus sibiricus]ACS89079.1 hypothetical protein TSIB_0008 [Thermococcus sibiricus MM 739]
MIGVVASIIGGLILKEYVMFIAPILFGLSLKNRDFGLVGYFLYIIYSSSKVVSGDVYTYEELMNALIFGFSGVLLLDDVLRREVRVRKPEIIPILFVLFGFVIPESFLAGGVLYFLMMKPDLKVALPVVGVILAFAIFKENLLGLGASGQAVVFGGFVLFTLTVAFLMREVKRVDMLR